MLVYGDQEEQADPQQRAKEINRRIDHLSAMDAGLARHARLVAVLVETGQLLQGLADCVFADERRDNRNDAIDELGATLLELAGAVCRSWDTGFRELTDLPRLTIPRGWPREVDIRLPEGFAFYAVYPEAYIEAARRLQPNGPPRVIGIRSIGTSLAATVAAALGAPPPVTVRPFGDPSAREIAIDPALERELIDDEPHYIIVDEGPGQSGSSFAAVGEWLEERGVRRERIAAIPSHAGAPGPAASEPRRTWWRSVQRQVGDFGKQWPQLIDRWCCKILGRLDEPPQEISGGAWRSLRAGGEQEWSPVVPAWERRKFLVRSRGEAFLAKFAGIGPIGERKLAIARALHRDGFVPEPVGLAHGFLIERWCDGKPLASGDKPVDEIARYIGTRARLLPASSGSGASAAQLLTMIRRNVAVEFGDEAARALDRWAGRTDLLDGRMVRVRTDNKLDRQEWLRTASGALIKCDALDHHQAHDLIGCQDLAWDCAGAIVEFELDQAQADQLVAVAGEWSCGSVDRALLEYCRIAYLAFRLGQVRLGATMICDPSERQRIKRRGDRYALELQHLLESSSRATRPESLVD